MITVTDVYNIAFAIIGSLGGGALIVFGLANWLGKIWAEKILQRESSRLRQEIFAYETRFGSLHKRRAEIIAEMYGKIVDFSYAATDYIGNPAHGKSAEESYFKSQTDLFTFFDRHKIYFPLLLTDALNDFIKRIRDKAITTSVYTSIPPTSHRQAEQQIVEKLMEAMNGLEKEMPELLRKLDAEFRKLLGVGKEA